MAECLGFHWNWPAVGVSSPHMARWAEGKADARPGGQGQVIACSDDR